MKTVFVISAVISGLLLLSTLTCGLWIRANHVTDASSISFHMNIGIITVIVGVISAILGIIIVLKK